YFGRSRVSVAADLEGVAVAVQKARTVSFVLRSAPGQKAEGACPANAEVTLTALDDFAARIDRTGEVNFVKEQAIADLAPARYQIGVNRLGESCSRRWKSRRSVRSPRRCRPNPSTDLGPGHPWRSRPRKCRNSRSELRSDASDAQGRALCHGVGDNGEARRRNELECDRGDCSGAGGRLGGVRGARGERQVGCL